MIPSRITPNPLRDEGKARAAQRAGRRFIAAAG
jgi:hypothetical protein